MQKFGKYVFLIIIHNYAKMSWNSVKAYNVGKSIRCSWNWVVMFNLVLLYEMLFMQKLGMHVFLIMQSHVIYAEIR